MARLSEKPGDFRRGDQQVSASKLNALIAGGAREIAGGGGADVEQFGDRYLIRQRPDLQRLPDITNYLAWAVVLKEYDDVLLCAHYQTPDDGVNSWLPYKYDPAFGSTQTVTFYVAKPVELRRVTWDGVTAPDGTGTFSFSGGYRRAGGPQRYIDRGYSPGDVIYCSRGVTSIKDPNGVDVFWCDLNVSARDWSDEANYALIRSGPATGSGAASGFYQGVLSDPIDGLSWRDASTTINVRAINNEALTYGDRYLVNFVEVGADGTAVYLAVATCCPQAPMETISYGGSGGGVVTVLNCPSCGGCQIPFRFAVTVSGVPDVLYGGVTGGSAWNGNWVMSYDNAGYDGPCFWSVRLPDTHGGGGGANGPWFLIMYGFDAGGAPGYGNAGWYVYYSLGGSQFPVTTVPAGGIACVGDTAVTVAAATGYPQANTTVTFHMLADCAEPPASGGGGGTTGNCNAGACGTAGVSPSLTATTSNRTGIYTSAPSSFAMSCYNDGGGHSWESTGSFTIGGATRGFVISRAFVGGGLYASCLTGPSVLQTAPDAGAVCYPFASVYHVDNGAGSTMTVTVTG